MRTQSNPAVTATSSAACKPLAAPTANSNVVGAPALHAISSPSSVSTGILASSFEAGHRRTASSPATEQQCGGSGGSVPDGEDLARLVENALNISSRPNSVDETPKDARDVNDAA